jgi:hypothetical protein
MLHPRTILGSGQMSKELFSIEPEPFHLKHDREEALQRCEANAQLICDAVNERELLLAVVEAAHNAKEAGYGFQEHYALCLALGNLADYRAQNLDKSTKGK